MHEDDRPLPAAPMPTHSRVTPSRPMWPIVVAVLAPVVVIVGGLLVLGLIVIFGLSGMDYADESCASLETVNDPVVRRLQGSVPDAPPYQGSARCGESDVPATDFSSWLSTDELAQIWRLNGCELGEGAAEPEVEDFAPESWFCDVDGSLIVVDVESDPWDDDTDERYVHIAGPF